MLVFHFLNAKYGLEAIEKRRLKISQFVSLNDPFEFLGVTLADSSLRHAMTTTIEQLNKNRGLLCFSSKWTNPVMWSHYADHHKGVCLGLELPDESLAKVAYIRSRFSAAPILSNFAEQEKVDFMLRLFSSKYLHWQYENEYRAFVDLDTPDPGSGLYFSYFSNAVRLRQVIVGASSIISRAQVHEALGSDLRSIECFKARLAYRSFNVVKNRNGKLWK
jgi:Protein of unknown function (DUF2971)